MAPDINGPETETLRESTVAGLAIGHLYQADVERTSSCERRLEATTGLAIAVSLVVGTVALTDERFSHATLLALMIVNLVFLHLEADRDADALCASARERVLLIERGRLAESFAGPVEPTGRRALVAALVAPPARPIYVRRVASRLRRAYMWVFVAVLVGWLWKLNVQAGELLNLSTVFDRAAVGLLPGTMVCLGVGVLYSALVLAAVSAIPDDTTSARLDGPRSSA
jgi:uncharacterized membrane protein